MAKFTVFFKKHWFAILLVAGGVIWFTFDGAIRGTVGGSITAIAGAITFIGRILSGRRSVSQNAQPGAAQAISNDSRLLRDQIESSKAGIESSQRIIDSGIADSERLGEIIRKAEAGANGNKS